MALNYGTSAALRIMTRPEHSSLFSAYPNTALTPSGPSSVAPRRKQERSAGVVLVQCKCHLW